jgi:GT2 family glycosyltransferase
LNTSLPVKLFLIDNSPTNELKHLFAEFLKDDRVEYIFNNKNLGFGAAHNVVLRRIVKKSTYHLVLNPDVTFEQNVLPSIYNYMENNSDVGLLMPKVLYPNGRIQHICKLIPSPSDLIFRRFLPSLLFKKQLNNYDLRFTGYNHLMEVPVLSGCFMFMRTAVLAKAGFFDERFFLYLEDTDLSRRFYMVAKNIYYPAVEIIHDHERGSYKNLKLLYIHSKSAIQYFNKWGWWADTEREQINEHVLHSVTSNKISRKSLKVKTA